MDSMPTELYANTMIWWA